MRILLDTSIAIWSICDTQKLPNKYIEQIGDENNEIFVSIASVWEIAIKNIAKPDKIPINENDFIKYCNQLNFDFLPIKINHIVNLKQLKFKTNGYIHKDPFDNIIVTQCMVEKTTLFTSDRKLSNYNYKKIVVI